jgi:hypothetical protein
LTAFFEFFAQRTMMVTRNLRIADFIATGHPAPGAFVEILCEDHIGTYVLPFLCRFERDGWRNAATGEPIEITVLGWRSRQSGAPGDRSARAPRRVPDNGK